MSNGIRVICPDCGDVVKHSCHTALKRAAYDLLRWVPEGGLATEKLEQAFEEAGREFHWIDEDEKLEDRFKRPFFGSQSWSYPLFGSKDDARSFHGLIHNLLTAAGLDPHTIEHEIHVQRNRREAAEKARLEGVKKRRDARARVVAYLKGKAPLEKRIAKLDEILRERAGVPGAKYSLVPYAEPNDPNAEGYSHLHSYIKTYYDGGISHEINSARIKKLETEAYDLIQDQKRQTGAL